jgi:hypothetical protein
LRCDTIGPNDYSICGKFHNPPRFKFGRVASDKESMDSTLLARIWADSGENTLDAETRVIEQAASDIEEGELVLTGNFKGQLDGWRKDESK